MEKNCQNCINCSKVTPFYPSCFCSLVGFWFSGWKAKACKHYKKTGKKAGTPTEIKQSSVEWYIYHSGLFTLYAQNTTRHLLSKPCCIYFVSVTALIFLSRNFTMSVINILQFALYDKRKCCTVKKRHVTSFAILRNLTPNPSFNILHLASYNKRKCCTVKKRHVTSFAILRNLAPNHYSKI